MPQFGDGGSGDIQRWLSDIDQALAAGDARRAVTWAERALSLGLEHPRLLQIRAMGRERAGRAADAVADLFRANALAPGDTGISLALAEGLMRLNRPAEAAEPLRRALSEQPDAPEVWFALGAALIRTGELTGARDAFEQAAALRPGFGAALGRLAILATHRGEGAEAARLAREALAVDPANPDARRALVEAALEARQGLEAETEARTWLALPGMGPNARFHALGLLGDALDLQRRQPAAFAAYEMSKAAFAEAHGGPFRGLDAHPIAAVLDAMRSEFRALPPELWAPAQAAPTARAGTPAGHIFLLGFMRSGTTLLEQALSRHPDIVTLEETEAMTEAGAAHLGAKGGLARIAAADEATLAAWRVRYFEAVRAAGVAVEGRVLVDKLPFNGIKLPLIARLFPEAKIIFAIRDPRDVVLSCFQRRLAPTSFAYEMRSLAGTARFYAAYMELVQAYRAALPLAVLDHRHEALVADFAGSVGEVCDFIGVDYRPEMTAFHTAARDGRVASQTARQLQGGLSTRGVGRWRAYAEHMAPVLPMLRPWAEAYGYPAD